MVFISSRFSGCTPRFSMLSWTRSDFSSIDENAIEQLGIAVVPPHSIFLINQNVYRSVVEVHFLRELDDCQERELAELLDIY
jgi:hypothetical protein